MTDMKHNAKRILITALEILAIAAVVWVIVFFLQGMGLADGSYESDAWTVCMPGDYVNVRSKPGRNGEVIGRFECGEKVRTDWEIKNGYVHVFVSLEETEGWIHGGYVSAWEPEWLGGAEAAVVSDGRVACRRWTGGPRISGRGGWIQPGQTVQVWYRTPEWCVTNRGYLKSEYLEVSK